MFSGPTVLEKMIELDKRTHPAPLAVIAEENSSVAESDAPKSRKEVSFVRNCKTVWMFQSSRDAEGNFVRLDDSSESLIHKVNTILDFNILEFEMKFFMGIWLAGMALILIVMGYHAYIARYTSNNRSVDYNDFLNAAGELLADEAASGKYPFLDNQEFLRRAFGKTDYIKYTLLKHKFSHDPTVMKSLLVMKESKVATYLQRLATTEIDQIFKTDHDCYMCFFIYWFIIGGGLHVLRKKFWTSYLGDMVDKLIETENTQIFSKLGKRWSIEKNLTMLKLVELPPVPEISIGSDKPSSASGSTKCQSHGQDSRYSDPTDTLESSRSSTNLRRVDNLLDSSGSGVMTSSVATPSIGSNSTPANSFSLGQSITGFMKKFVTFKPHESFSDKDSTGSGSSKKDQRTKTKPVKAGHTDKYEDLHDESFSVNPVDASTML